MSLFYTGKHKWGLLPVTGLAGDMNAVKEVLNEEQLVIFEKKVANELPRGYASFHHPLTMHGFYENYSNRPRRAVVINAMDHHTLGNTAGYDRLNALEHFPPMPQGQLLYSIVISSLFYLMGTKNWALLERQYQKLISMSYMMVRRLIEPGNC